jgi:GNAT superfamily N-acetyltransferase
VPEEELWNSIDIDVYLFQPKDLYFEPKKLLQQPQRAKLELLQQNNPMLVDSILVEDEATGIPVLIYHGYQKSFDSYYMQLTAVHPDYRRYGIYSAFLERMIAYTAELGFSTVLSCHSPINNAVLIAKLKHNFKITAMDVDEHLGVNIWLTYFHNKNLECAFALRCGHLTLNQALVDASYGTAEQFCNLLKKFVEA